MEKNERIDAYLKRLALLKERSSLREVVERELLYECILANREGINEYPLLEPQQRSVLEFLTHRAQEHPGQEFVHKVLAAFVGALTKYSKLMDSGDAEATEDARREVFNAETVLVKLVQGAVYATALAVDNFGEVIIRYFGAESMEKMDEILKEVELGEKFWRDHVEHFITQLVEGAYRDIIATNRHSLTKQNSILVLSIAFDDVLGCLKRTAKQVEKTRVQQYFEQDAATDEAVEIQKLAFDHLARMGESVLRAPLTRTDLAFLARFVSVDQAGRDYLADARHEPGGEEFDEQRRHFVKRQVLALALGADLASCLMTEDLVRAVHEFEPREIETIRRLVRHFEIESLEATLVFMLQCQLSSLLRRMGAEEGGKLQVRTTQVRRTPADTVQALFDAGLNRIRKSKIWEQDPAREDMLLFRPRTARELADLLAVLQIEEPLAARIIPLWENAAVKVDILVLINVALIAKTTTNLKMRLAKILGDFGIGGRREGEAGLDL
jgi:hypothetical protein